jgi:hypothetical protein
MAIIAALGGLVLFTIVAGVSLAIIDIKSGTPITTNEKEDNSIRLAASIMGSTW